jgi:hypothetical protein
MLRYRPASPRPSVRECDCLNEVARCENMSDSHDVPEMSPDWGVEAHRPWNDPHS